jgi:hypothetical protein
MGPGGMETLVFFTKHFRAIESRTITYDDDDDDDDKTIHFKGEVIFVLNTWKWNFTHF